MVHAARDDAVDHDLTRVLLVVEDDPDIRLIIRMHLGSDPRLLIEGEATSAAEAIDLARRTEPGLIILDHRIEGSVMGLDAAEALKAAAPQARILLFTAFDMRREAEASPFIDAFLSKTDFPLLLPAARRLLSLPAP